MKRDVIVRIDTNNYLRENMYEIHLTPRVNKKVPGLMKDENSGAIITEFAELRAQMYAKSNR